MRNIYSVEYTDTFCGEANYSWVKRAEISVIPLSRDTIYTSAATIAKERKQYDRDVVTKAKAAIGLTGVKCRKTDFGDMIELRPIGYNTVCFITFKESIQCTSAITV